MNGDNQQSYDSPAGTLRIICETFWEDRIGQRTETQVIDPRSGAILAALSGISLEGRPAWTPDGGADFGVHVAGAKCRVRIVPDQSFVLHPTEDPRPLASLAAELWAQAPRAPASPSPASGALGWGTILGSLAFVAVGVAAMVYPRPGRRDFWWGLLSIVFFGAIALLGLWERRRRQ